MKRIIAYTLLLFFFSCSDTGEESIICTYPISSFRNYNGAVSTINGEGFELRISLDKDIRNCNAECSYLSLFSGELKPGYIDGAGGYYQFKDDAFTIYVSDTVYMSGRYLDNMQSIEVSWNGSLGKMWDTCAVRYNWPRNIVLSLFHED